MTYFVAMGIGCTECGEPSTCYGVFTQHESAEATGGVVFEVAAIDSEGSYPEKERVY